MKAFHAAAAAAATLAIFAFSAEPAAAAADREAMIDQCRRYAAEHLDADPGMINVSYKDQGEGGRHHLEGDVEGPHGRRFECNFSQGGHKIRRFVVHGHRGCPADVTAADRYKYPDCD